MAEIINFLKLFLRFLAFGNPNYRFRAIAQRILRISVNDKAQISYTYKEKAAKKLSQPGESPGPRACRMRFCEAWHAAVSAQPCTKILSLWAFQGFTGMEFPGAERAEPSF